MLTLIGIGLADEGDVSLRGLEKMKRSDKVYIDTYTNAWNGRKILGEMIGKDILELGRAELEQDSDIILDESSKMDVSILVPGDPMVATTHITLIGDAKKRGIETGIIHNSSIISAICETGLHVYKFGASATVPFIEKTGGKDPESVYRVLEMNKKNGSHTLFLMDIMDDKMMTANKAIELLLKMEETLGKGLFTRNTHVVVAARLGYKDSILKYGKAENLAEYDFGEPPMVLIVPGKLHFSEEEYLLTLK